MRAVVVRRALATVVVLAAVLPLTAYGTDGSPYAGLHRTAVATFTVAGGDHRRYSVVVQLDASEQASTVTFATLVVTVRCSAPSSCHSVATYTKALTNREYDATSDLNISEVVTSFGKTPFGVMWYAPAGYGQPQTAVPSTDSPAVASSEAAHVTLLVGSLKCTTNAAAVTEWLSVAPGGDAQPTGSWPHSPPTPFHRVGRSVPTCHAD